MSDYSNEDRAERASATLTYYKTEIMKEVCEQNSAEIADLITDLLHLTRLWDQGDDPIESTIRVARINFEAEEEEEEEVFGCTCGVEIPKSDMDEVNAHIAQCNGEPKEDDDDDDE